MEVTADELEVLEVSAGREKGEQIWFNKIKCQLPLLPSR